VQKQCHDAAAAAAAADDDDDVSTLSCQLFKKNTVCVCMC